MKLTKPQLYNLVWIVNGKVKEIVMRNATKPLCLFKKRNLEKTTHRTGLLQCRKVQQY